MKITKFFYFNDEVGFGEYGGLDDPYLQNLDEKTDLSKSLRWKADPLRLRWKAVGEDGECIESSTHNLGRSEAAISLDRRYLVVVFSGDPTWEWPFNSAVFNADGSLRGKITPPKEITPQPIEGIGGVKSENEKIVLWCYYNFDRLAYIEFDPEKMEWGQVVHIGGRA